MKTILCLLLMILLSIPSFAYYTCTGPVKGVSIQASGTNSGLVWVTGFNGIVDGGICQIGATANGITSDTCKAIYTRLLIAEVTGQQLTMYFNDNLTCSTQPSWAYMTGLYFGPGTL